MTAGSFSLVEPIRHARGDPSGFLIKRHRLHQIREKAGHNLMFLELRDGAGIRIPDAHRYRPRLNG